MAGKPFENHWALLSLKYFILFTLIIATSLTSGAQIPTKDLEETNQKDDKDINDESFKGSSDGIAKLIPLPHVLCTGFSVSRLYESCFPVGCKCANGAGLCNLKNECVRVQLPFNLKKDVQVNFDTDI